MIQEQLYSSNDVVILINANPEIDKQENTQENTQFPVSPLIRGEVETNFPIHDHLCMHNDSNALEPEEAAR